MRMTREEQIETFIGRNNMDKHERIMFPIEFVTEITDDMEYVNTCDELGFPLDIYKDKNWDQLYGYIDYPSELDDEEEDEMDINKAESPVDIFNDAYNGKLKYECPNCGNAFYVADRCPDCGQLIKRDDRIIREIECECYDDFMTQWFELTKDMLNSTSRAELIGTLLKVDTGKDNKFYVTTQEDDWAMFVVVDEDKVMEKLYECECFYDSNYCTYPIIREIELKETPSMYSRLFKTVNSYLETNLGYFEDNEKEEKDLREQLVWLTEMENKRKKEGK